MSERKQKLLDEAALSEYALKVLAGRALSLAELKDRLRKKAARASDVDVVLARLKQYGYIDDRRFAETYANARLNNQGFGKMRVLRDLQRKRVARTVAEGAVETAFRDTDETALIEEFLARKFRNVDLAGSLADPKRLAAAYRRLRHAGFSSGNTIRVLKRYARQAEELESLESPEEEQGGELPSLE